MSGVWEQIKILTKINQLQKLEIVCYKEENIIIISRFSKFGLKFTKLK